MCDICQEMIDLVTKYDSHDANKFKMNKTFLISKNELNLCITYVNVWVQKHCICCYKDHRNFERFNNLVHSVLQTVLHLLRVVAYQLANNSDRLESCEQDDETQLTPTSTETHSSISTSKSGSTSSGCSSSAKMEEEASCKPSVIEVEMVTAIPSSASSLSAVMAVSKKFTKIKQSRPPSDDYFDDWNDEDRDRLLILGSKVFHVTFPHYVAHKHSIHYRIEDLSPKEASLFSSYCDLSENDLPIFLLRNIVSFCDAGGIELFIDVFSSATPERLPLSTAHAMIAVINNLKPWMNSNLMIQKLVVLRTNVIEYLCKVPDKDLRIMSNRTMFEFIWSVLKEHFDIRNGVADKEGLTLALKYFTSSTLTMRLTGIAQINNFINIFSELCASESNGMSSIHVDSMGDELAVWIIDNKIIEHVFGPNSHVEVIKQSNIVLSFVVGRITLEHIDVIWSAAQMKHCGKAVLDVLLPLTKNLHFKAVLHLYSLLRNLEPKDHTEQTLMLASNCLKYIWMQTISHSPGDLIISNVSNSPIKTMFYNKSQIDMSPIFTMLPSSQKRQRELGDTSSTSGSVDGSEEDEEEDDYEVDVTRPMSVNVGTSGNKDFNSQVVGSNVMTEEVACFNESSNSGSSSEGSSESEDEEESGSSTTQEKPLKSEHFQKLSPLTLNKLAANIFSGDQSSSDEMIPAVTIVDEVVESIHRDNYNRDNRTNLSNQFCDDANMENEKNESKENQEMKIESHEWLKLIGEKLIKEKKEKGNGDEISDVSCASKLSDKNMADFDGEDSDNELAEIVTGKSDVDEDEAVRDERDRNIMKQLIAKELNLELEIEGKEDEEETVDDKIDMLELSFDNVCKPGRTILWDLLQDDKIHQLSEGLSQEAEKIFWSTVGCLQDRRLRLKFIEGCLDNLAKNYSVITSLRLLCKILQSFQHFRNGDTHQIVLWADKERQMLKHFFNNLILYSNNRKQTKADASCSSSNEIYSHTEEIQTRLNFLSFIFSIHGSPDSFCLTREQIDILWSTLGTDSDSCDEMFSWLLSQLRERTTHGLSMDMSHHILTEKFPQLSPDNFSMVALELLQSLSNMLIASDQNNSLKDVDAVAIKQLWNIALKSSNVEVSMTAIKHLNNYYVYIHPNPIKLDKEEEFIKQCMGHLDIASKELNENEDKNFTIIQRALTLLKTHLEAFRCRYSFYFRKWQLAGDNTLMSHRGKERTGNLVRISCQPASIQEKVTFELQSTDYVGELRAEVTHWWEGIIRKFEDVTSGDKRMGLMNDGPLRLLTQGQEITQDLDEKQLCEVGFKDMHVVYVSTGMARSFRKFRDSVEPASVLPPPSQERLPFLLLLRPEYFERLFSLMQQLGSLSSSAHIRAQVLSRRVWEIIQMLPTSPNLLGCFQSISVGEMDEDVDADDAPMVTTPSTSQIQLQPISESFNNLLSPHSPQKLMYSCQIVDALRRNCKNWAQQFVDKEGLQHLFDIFISGVLQPSDGDAWNEWKQDCLASLLQLIYQFGVNPLHNKTRSSLSSDDVNDNKTDDEKTTTTTNINITSNVSVQQNIASTSFSGSSTPSFISEIIKKNKRSRKGSMEKALIVPQLNSKLLLMIRDVDSMLRVLLTILNEATSKTSDASPTYQTGFWGRAQVVHHTFTFFISWAFSDPQIRTSLYQSQNLDQLLKKLVLDDPDPAIRREATSGLYRLCLGHTPDGKNGRVFIPQLLNSLLSFLKVAQSMRDSKANANAEIVMILQDKEPYGPGCKDYFWLLCRLVESLDVQQLGKANEKKVDLDGLCTHIAEAITKREVKEMRHNIVEDDGLRGLLCLMTVTIKHNPPFKFSKEGNKFLSEVFDSLFSLPNQLDKNLPKCKHSHTRSAAFDLLVELVKGCEDNYVNLVGLLMEQHNPEMIGRLTPYPWDYWPHDDCRSECGYVGLTNLGATCYMASCMQHLYMLPEARYAILSANLATTLKHDSILKELQRMFIFLLESERKAYNPKSFCKVYTMDHQPLNTGEQKDMTEFFTDLISKLEEMTVEMKEMVKCLFSGTLSNNVVSLDCPHISRTTEEFYTLRCQVSDMRNLNESLDEITVKDTLEGDNMYTCSRCGRKVRAEKRACIKKLPKILCFNTMRYTFNMVTMTKEKVNTHFSFPIRLDMAPYLEKNLIPEKETDLSDPQDVFMKEISDYDLDEDESTEFELIGVTVHTGTADGGHYYSFIREREASGAAKDKWYLFNDAEVKYFDSNQLATECFGGEMTSKTYDSVTDKFMDFSFEKTNSAYMLFYERVDKTQPKEEKTYNFSIEQNSSELTEWIGEDNISFLRDKSIFEHTYFEFMWQICGYIPQTLPNSQKITLLSARLATSFLLETLIHAKEKPTIANWVELVTKQFNSSQSACEWLMDHLSVNDWWPIQILLRCPNQMVRQLFQRLCIHVITQLKPTQTSLYLQPLSDDSEDSNDAEVISHVGQFSCVTRFIRKLLELISLENISAKPHLKHLTEYFAFLYEFAKQGDEECKFLLAMESISTVVTFYMAHCGKSVNEYVEVMSEDDDEEDEYLDDVINSAGVQKQMGQHMGPTVGPEDKFPKPASLDKMITFVALLVEKSRRKDNRLKLSDKDFEAIAGGKSFPFIQQQIRDCINLRQTCNLISSLCKSNETYAMPIIHMIFTAITRSPETSAPFFKVLSMLIEMSSNASQQILISFSHLVIPKVLEIAEQTPLQAMEWLTIQATRNKLVSVWILQTIETSGWIHYYLIAHKEARVRANAAHLLISLVPNAAFRQSYRPNRPFPFVTMKEYDHSGIESLREVDQIFRYLLNLLKTAKQFVDPAMHGTQKLVTYFTVMSYFLISHRHKQMLVPYFVDLWNLFQPKLSEPPIAVNHNKQALLVFWHQACIDCPENVRCIVNSPQVIKNIAFNYILADHEDQEVVYFNRSMLPQYYGLLRLCCIQSRPFTRNLALHQNIQWAFKNITPYQDRYPFAVQELFKLMKIFITTHPDSSESELKDILTFKKTTLQMYLTSLEPRTSWQALLNMLQIIVENEQDRIFLLQIDGLTKLFQLFAAMYVMFHEATACNITNDIVDCLKFILTLLKTLFANQEHFQQFRELRNSLRDSHEVIRKILLLINSYTPAHVRISCLDVLLELAKLYPIDCLSSIVQHLAMAHLNFKETTHTFVPGPYFPRRGQRVMLTKSSVRPARPLFQMCFNSKMLDVQRGVDKEYDASVNEYFTPYYMFIDGICRIACQNRTIANELVGLCTFIASESFLLRLTVFPKLWVDLIQMDNEESAIQYVQFLCTSSYFKDYIFNILSHDRPFINEDIVYQMIKLYLPKIPNIKCDTKFSAFNSSNMQITFATVKLFSTNFDEIDHVKLKTELININGVLRSFYLVYMNCDSSDITINKEFVEIFNKLKEKCEQQLIKADSGVTPQKRRKLREDKESEGQSTSTQDEDEGTNTKQTSSQQQQQPESNDAKNEEEMIETNVVDNHFECERVLTSLSEILELLGSKL